jgi:hyperosmotically inducible protein
MSLLLKLSIALLAMVLHVAALNAATSDDKAIAADSDRQITEQIRTALYKNPALASNDISVQTKDGVVYLHGLVDTNVQRAAVKELVQGLAGVKRIVDSLELRNDVR